MEKLSALQTLFLDEATAPVILEGWEWWQYLLCAVGVAIVMILAVICHKMIKRREDAIRKIEDRDKPI